MRMELVVINEVLAEGALVTLNAPILLGTSHTGQFVLDPKPPEVESKVAREAVFIRTDKAGTMIGADRLRQIASLDKSLARDRDRLFRGERRSPFRQSMFENRTGRSHIANVQERIFLRRAIELLLDDEVHLPQLV